MTLTYAVHAQRTAHSVLLAHNVRHVFLGISKMAIIVNNVTLLALNAYQPVNALVAFQEDIFSMLMVSAQVFAKNVYLPAKLV